ncbi:hypothetical protein [Rhodopseudomonas pseudopalustris]|uniref:Uncharacterized protein n=1 Tax=Rhodopseudomonas pseudopalustris TaxID=1513892 RepID=A0A1H8NYX8_9BRAD|nr:hypothetical protein [Rhodopseudomonas pseudopalustris]SEO34802.1 hypothetical protein SAMN05444123_102335 [Rhodopseudomonas pseudopalustris]
MNYARLLTGSAGLDAPPTHPLTHHEILGLVRPFTHRGFHVDLDASERINRRLIFKPVTHNEADPAGVNACEVLQLDNPRQGFSVLTRTLTHACGLSATLETQGEDPDALLARIEAVLPHQQFRSVDGTIVALNYRLIPSDSGKNAAPTAVTRELLRGVADIAGFTLVLRPAHVKGYPVEIDITPKVAGAELPEDLLAVLGWAWSPLRKSKAGWSGKLKVRGAEPELSRAIEARLEKTVAHLTHTLTQPPAAYHDALARARWVVALRRSLPLLFFGGLILGAAGLTLVEIPQDSIVNLLLMGAPPLLMIGAFGMRDIPSMEIPPLPRRITHAAWHPQIETAAPQTLDVQLT